MINPIPGAMSPISKASDKAAADSNAGTLMRLVPSNLPPQTPTATTSTTVQTPNASLTNQTPLIKTYKADVTWKNRLYKFTLNIPPLQNEDKDHIQTELTKAAHFLLEDLNAQNKGDSIKPGENCNFVFLDDGYVAFKDNVLTNDEHTKLLSEGDLNEVRDKEGVIIGEKEESKKLSAVFRESSTTKKLSERLEEEPAFKPYREAMKAASSSKKPQENKQVSLKPVGLLNSDAKSCYLNSAFRLFADNSIICEELLAHPEAFTSHAQNPFYSALKDYDTKRKTSDSSSMDLTSLKNHICTITELNPNSQNDAHEALMALLKSIDVTKLPPTSAIYSVSANFTQQGNDRPRAHIETRNDIVTHLQVPELAQRIIDPDLNSSLEDLLTKPMISPNPNASHSTSKFETLPGALLIEANRFKTTGQITKNETSIDKMALELRLPQELCKTPYKSVDDNLYDLSSFLCHIGKSVDEGHYITYSKDESGQYWESNDAVITPIDKKTFLDKAKTGYLFTFNKRHLNGTLSKSASPTDAKAIPVEEKQIGETNIQTIIGDIAEKSDMTIVNFTNSTLRKKTNIFTKAEIEEQVTAARKDNTWKLLKFFNRDEGLFSLGEIATTQTSKLNGDKGIIHAVVFNDHDEIDKAAFKAAVLKSLENRKQKGAIAFEIPNELRNDQTVQVHHDLKLIIEEYCKKKSLDVDQISKIEIVLTKTQYDAIFPKNNQAAQPSPKGGITHAEQEQKAITPPQPSSSPIVTAPAAVSTALPNASSLSTPLTTPTSNTIASAQSHATNPTAAALSKAAMPPSNAGLPTSSQNESDVDEEKDRPLSSTSPLADLYPSENDHAANTQISSSTTTPASIDIAQDPTETHSDPTTPTQTQTSPPLVEVRKPIKPLPRSPIDSSSPTHPQPAPSKIQALGKWIWNSLPSLPDIAANLVNDG
jgi:hypothetical protein